MATRRTIRALERWYQKVARPLPWRETRDPYAIWISEVMLQQTQVATVLPYYEKFLSRWPTLEALAKAPEKSVLSAWSGLGYYSRAKNLRKGAQYLVKHHTGRFPKTRDEMLKVPGIGPYTAGAILSIAFDLKEPLVDGNVIRVFSRYFGEKRPIELSQVQKQFWKHAKSWVEACASPRYFNQALMELGATVCAKQSPRCTQCPIKQSCYAFENNSQALLPVRKPKRKPKELWWAGVVLRHKGKLFVHKNSKNEWWSDMWDFPHQEVSKAKDLPKLEKKLIKDNPQIKRWKKLGVHRHTVTHHKIHFVPYLCDLDRPSPLKSHRGQWWSPKKLRQSPTSSLVKKVLSSLQS